MATIRNRGEYQWEAQNRRKGYPAQRKTFETKADAQAWARMIESEIDRGIFVSRVEAERTAFHQLIDRYISEIAPKHKGAYSEIKRLEALKRHPLATRIVATLTSSDFARYRDERLKIRKHVIFLEELKRMRVESGMTQAQCSAALGRPQSFMSDVERGVRRLDIVQLRDLCLVLGNDLIGFTKSFEHALSRDNV